MTISTTLLFSRAVDLMGRQQSDLGGLQEKVATGKQVVRPSDSPDAAVNIARLKSAISEFDGYKASLESTNDRLRVEESYVQNATDVLSSVKQLAIQGANGTMGPLDRLAVAVEVEELTSELINIANGTDPNGNYLFAGSRNQLSPYQVGDDGVARYTGDTYQAYLDYTRQRRSPIGRSGPEIFTPVLTGEYLDAKNQIQRIDFSGSIEVGDVYNISVNGRTFTHTLAPRESKTDLVNALVREINAANDAGSLPFTRASNNGTDSILVEGLNGSRNEIRVSTDNTDQSIKRGVAAPINLDTVLDPSNLQFEKRTIDFSPPFDFSEIDDVVTLRVGDVGLISSGQGFSDLNALVDDFKSQGPYANLEFTLDVDSTGDKLIVEWNVPKAIPNTTKVEFGGGGSASASLISVSDNNVVVNNEGADLDYGIILEGPFERGDKVAIAFEGVQFEYVIDGFEDAEFPRPANLGIATATNIELGFFAGTFGESPIDYSGIGASRLDNKSDRIHLTLTSGNNVVNLDTGSINQAVGGIADVVNELNATLANSGNTKYVVSASADGNLLVSRLDGREFSVGLGNNHNLDNKTIGKVNPELKNGGVIVQSSETDESRSVISLAFNDPQTSAAGADLGIAAGATFKVKIEDANPAIGSITLEVATPDGFAPGAQDVANAFQRAFANAGLSQYSAAVGLNKSVSLSRSDGVAFSLEIVEGSALTSLTETAESWQVTAQDSVLATNKVDVTKNLYDALGARYVSLRGVREALVAAINDDPLIGEKLVASEYRASDTNYVGDPGSSIIRFEPVNTANPGRIQAELVDRGDLNDQGLTVSVQQVAAPAIPERIEFFEVLKNLSDALRADNQDGIRAQIDQITQMINSTTLSLADIGSEMMTIASEVDLNEQLKLQFQSALSSQEDLDYAAAITQLQAKMLSLEAAQASFAKISQLSLFDYLR
jgi:flagellar hook-associated protein 3